MERRCECFLRFLLLSVYNPDLQSLRYISVIGASMGGIYLRYLLPRLAEICTKREWTLHNYISLASPHLGASGVHTKFSKRALSLTKTGYDLLCESTSPCGIESLCCDTYYLDALRVFQKRVSYAPVYQSQRAWRCFYMWISKILRSASTVACLLLV